MMTRIAHGTTGGTGCQGQHLIQTGPNCGQVWESAQGGDVGCIEVIQNPGPIPHLGSTEDSGTYYILDHLNWKLWDYYIFLVCSYICPLWSMDIDSL